LDFQTRKEPYDTRIILGRRYEKKGNPKGYNFKQTPENTGNPKRISIAGGEKMKTETSVSVRISNNRINPAMMYPRKKRTS
jgi:hypothetical protein